MSQTARRQLKESRPSRSPRDRPCCVLFTSCTKAVEIAKQTSRICLRDAVGVYLNSTAKGMQNGTELRWNEYEVDIKLDVNLASKLVDHLQSNGIAAEGITATEGMLDMPLQWGEVIPMHVVPTRFDVRGRERSKSSHFYRPCQQGERSNTFAWCSHHWTYYISTFLRGLDQRVLYVSSGDLAHNHKTDCQNELYLPDPRWTVTLSPIALRFDVCVENWIKGTCSLQSKEEDGAHPEEYK